MNCGNCEGCGEGCCGKLNLGEFFDSLSKKVFGIERSEAINKNICVSCHNEVDVSCLEELDRKEYLQSGICPICFNSICGDV